VETSRQAAARTTRVTTMKTPKALDKIVDIVLAYRPKARSKPAVQRKRRRTILKNAKEKS
jgi:hypothetical protein